MSNQTEEGVTTLQRGDRIRMTEKSIAFHGMRGTVTNTEATAGYIGVWLDGDIMERWPSIKDVAREFQAAEAKIQKTGATMQAGFERDLSSGDALDWLPLGTDNSGPETQLG